MILKDYWKDITLLMLVIIFVVVSAVFIYTHRNDHSLLHQLVTIEVQRQQAAQKQQPARTTPELPAAVQQQTPTK